MEVIEYDQTLEIVDEATQRVCDAVGEVVGRLDRIAAALATANEHLSRLDAALTDPGDEDAT